MPGMPAPFTPAAPTTTGLVLEPFRALRYDPRRVSDLAAVTSPPYDVIDEAAVRALEARDPHNVVRLILPRDDAGVPGSRYARAARTLAEWRSAGVLRADPDPALYVYEERTDGHVQRGLVGALRLVPPGAGIVLPHENTMAGPVADRLALTAATAANLEAILLVYDGGAAARDVVAAAAIGNSLLDAVTDDGIAHRIWAVTDPAALAAVADDLRPRRATIADGHHRYATYLRYQEDRHAAGAGGGPWDAGLVYLVDATAFGPQVSAVHRVIAGLPAAEAARRAARHFRVRPLRAQPAAGDALGAGALAEIAATALADAGRQGVAFAVVGEGAAYLLTDPDRAAMEAALPRDRSPAWRSLDVTIAHAFLVQQVWRLADTEEIVGFAHDAREAVVAANEQGGTALLLNPTPVSAVAAVAAAGDRMPRKSTFFTPKPRTGLLLRAFADG